MSLFVLHIKLELHPFANSMLNRRLAQSHSFNGWSSTPDCVLMSTSYCIATCSLKLRISTGQVLQLVSALATYVYSAHEKLDILVGLISEAPAHLESLLAILKK